jgi:hypothetical protein
MLNGWGVSEPQPPHGRENVRNPFRSHDDSWIKRHEQDIQNIRAVNRQRYRAFRDRFHNIERTLDLVQSLQNSMVKRLNQDRERNDDRLQWQHDALQEQINDLTQRMDLHRESINIIMQILTVAKDMSERTDGLLENAQQRDEALRKALNQTSETVLKFINKHGDDEDQEGRVGLVGDAMQDRQGLNDEIIRAINASGGHVPGTDEDDDDDVVIPEDIQAFIDFLQAHAPEGTEIEVLGAATIPNREDWEDNRGPVLVQDDGMGNHFEYDAAEAIGVSSDGTQHAMKIQTLESWRRNGPQNPADAVVNAVRAAKEDAMQGLATTEGDTMRVLGPPKRID